MTCIEAQAMITPFIQDNLNMEQMEEFLQHVNHCPACMEELEIYYAVLTAVQQLDADKDLSNNYLEDLIKKLVKSAERIRRAKRMKVRRRIALLATILFFAVFSSIQLGEIVTESPQELELTGTCSFRLGDGLFTGTQDVIADMFRERNVELLLYADSVRYPEDEFTGSVIRDHSMWDVEE